MCGKSSRANYDLALFNFRVLINYPIFHILNESKLPEAEFFSKVKNQLLETETFNLQYQQDMLYFGDGILVLEANWKSLKLSYVFFGESMRAEKVLLLRSESRTN